MQVQPIYRDPRDAMLSAYEYGQRALKKGRPNAFSHLTDFQISLDFIMEYIHIWDMWMADEITLHTRYEDLKLEYLRETERLIAFLGLNSDDPVLQEVIERHRPERAREGQKGAHFSTGISGRFREVFTAEEQKILLEKLGPYLDRMGYE
jgi:hypothetical protein